MTISTRPSAAATTTTRRCDENDLSTCTCGKAIVRMIVSYNMSTFVQRSITPWLGNLPPSIANGYHQQKRDGAEGRQWKGAAVLVTGQVRSGLQKEVIMAIRKSIFDPLRSYGEVHSFAVLEFTIGGITWHAEKDLQGFKHRHRTFTRASVENMLALYGAKFTLLEATPADDDLGPNSSFMSKMTCAPLDERWTTHVQQFQKVDQAMKLMQSHEETRGRPFALVVRIRPDVSYIGQAGPTVLVKGLPSICRSVGGVPGDRHQVEVPRGDAYLVADRYAAFVFANYWKYLWNCPIEHIDECQSKEELHELCKIYMPTGFRCKNIFLMNILRHGLIESLCLVKGTIIRPKAHPKVKEMNVEFGTEL